MAADSTVSSRSAGTLSALLLSPLEMGPRQPVWGRAAALLQPASSIHMQLVPSWPDGLTPADLLLPVSPPNRLTSPLAAFHLLHPS